MICPEKSASIGVFDSGMGGISTLRELIARLPGENFLFYGDDKNAPYGIKTVDQVRTLAEDCVEHLMAWGPLKAVVIACNTATGAAAGYLREKYPDLIIIGAEPALKPAVRYKEHSRVLVMATPLTLQTVKFKELERRVGRDSTVLELPCPGLMEFVERGIVDGEELLTLLHTLLDPYVGKVDSVVLGCTHYPFLQKAISGILGQGVPLFDGNEGIAAETARRLAEKGLLSDNPIGSVHYDTSSKNPGTREIAMKLLQI
ncbi:MAG: glutamate racemase [Eubacteriales bacterium]